MSTELEPFFAALRHDAEALPAAAPADVRRLGRRRRRRRAVVAAAAAFAVVGAIAIVFGAGLPHGRPHTTDPATPGPTSTEAPPRFGKLTPVGPGIGNGSAEPPRSGSVTAMGDRAFVGRQSETGRTSVTAVDLTTGRTAWGPVELATFHDYGAVYWHPRYVLVMGRHDDGTKPDGTIFTLDPATGRTLTRLDVDGFESDDIVIGESTVVIASRRDGMTRAYDLATGRVQWAVPDPPSRIVHSQPMESAAGPPAAALRNAFGGAPLADRQFVQLTADGTAILRDLATGAESARRTGAVSPAGPNGERDGVLAVGGVLYAVDHATMATIRATDLTRPAAPVTIYTAEPGVRIGGPLWCGPARICFSGEGGGTVGFVGFDTGRRTVVWSRNGTIIRAQALDGRTLVNGSIYDAAGRQLLKEQTPPLRTAAWVDSRSALLFDTSAPDRGVAVLGVTPLDADPVPLGSIGQPIGCGWSRTHLACVTPDGVSVWRFAT